ncbi:uncharacterized protein CLUP02_02384 [Colletotrichum lupini]|uniref:Uncharacterized protein n=1 Tax=Colletotrichum lupini TaxID=145971 RepID=A0A9Q8SGZ6_9PEZI|nr:uncharacterized protein CLUP02_02384 [Colletotrichum lupini]UQC76918.1 hypothetical protein CLUP02_02384 [Colletotrichum lupini]
MLLPRFEIQHPVVASKLALSAMQEWFLTIPKYQDKERAHTPEARLNVEPWRGWLSAQGASSLLEAAWSSRGKINSIRSESGRVSTRLDPRRPTPHEISPTSLERNMVHVLRAFRAELGAGHGHEGAKDQLGGAVRAVDQVGRKGATGALRVKEGLLVNGLDDPRHFSFRDRVLPSLDDGRPAFREIVSFPHI